MTNKTTIPNDTKKRADVDTKKPADVSHPGMMGDGTEEQNLDQRGNPAARIKKEEVDTAFGNQPPKK